ncbi:MAG: hypothetical protein IJA74_03320 [Oscillospiraceae bacterium]|nr:hypothetical protein [Oscillospiraceae bacterium]
MLCKVKLNFTQRGSDINEERTGVALPKGKSYLMNGSALSRKAAEHGYKITDIREEPVIVKTVFFKKK